MAADRPPATSGRTIRVLKASDVLANELRARILEENLRPGDALPPETQLIEQHGLSRGTVREALRLLESEGFIRIQRGPRGGITVQYPDEQLISRSLATLLTVDATPLRDLFHFRKLIEPAAAAAAAADATDEQRQHLLDVTRPTVLTRGDASFHTLVANCVGNELLRVILSVINRIVDWHTGLDQVSEPDFEAAGVAHERLAQSIADGKADLAARQMLKHIEAFETVMQDAGRLDEATLPRARWVSYLRQMGPSQ